MSDLRIPFRHDGACRAEGNGYVGNAAAADAIHALQKAAHEFQRLLDVTLQFCVVDLLGRGVRTLPAMIAAAIHVQLVEVLDDRQQWMSDAGYTDFADDGPYHVLFAELRRVKCAAERFENRPDFLDDIHPLALAVGKEPLQRLDVRAVAGLHGSFDVPFRDRRVFLADPREPERLPVRRSNASPD